MHALGCAGGPQEGNDQLRLTSIPRKEGVQLAQWCVSLMCTGLLNMRPHKFLLILFSWQKLLWVSPHS